MKSEAKLSIPWVPLLILAVGILVFWVSSFLEKNPRLIAKPSPPTQTSR